jgi:hypothetical protein
MPAVIRVFDPAMCCSTGVCGPSVDPDLARFAADVDWLQKQGVQVERFNLSQQPAAFAETSAVKAALERGTDVLPLVLVGDRVAVEGSYPSRETLAALAGVVVKKPEAASVAKASCCGPSIKSEEPAPKASGCCGPSTKSEASSPKKSGCC